jgi:hypothetical protein
MLPGFYTELFSALSDDKYVKNGALAGGSIESTAVERDPLTIPSIASA